MMRLIGLVFAVGLLALVGEAANPASMFNHIMMGYQGWFESPDEGSGNNRWRHWSKSSGSPANGNLAFDLYPDMSEYPSGALTGTTDLTYRDGSHAKLFTAYHSATQDVHFRWMQENDLDGVFLQRFVSELKDSTLLKVRNQVLQNVMDKAAARQRTFAIMYDTSGAGDDFLSVIQNDWWKLTHSTDYVNPPLCNASYYQYHDGKPVVVVWGLGFTGHPGDHNAAFNTVNWFQLNGYYFMGGVPYHWRTGDSDSKPGFSDVYAKMDMLSPWSVGRYNSDTAFKSNYNNRVVPDKSLTDSRKQAYAPVAFPGFSWSNLKNDPSKYNEIPRNGGDFYTTQLSSYVKSLKPTMVYIAMFDEVNEGTAIFKAANSTSQLPTNAKFTYLGMDGKPEDKDHYLKLTSSWTRTMRQNSRPCC